MIVAIDTLLLSGRYANTGTHTYSTRVLKACLRITEAEALDVEFHGFVAPDDNWAVNGFVSRALRVHQTRMLSRKRFWRLGGMAFSTSLVRPDLVFLPTGQGSVPGPFSPVVTTILDAMPKRLPPELLVGRRRSHFLTWASAKLARRIITISEWSKRDLVEVYGLDPAKVEVTYLGYDKRLYNDTPPDGEASAALLSRFGIRRPFVLHHGMVQLRKNLVRLIQAWDCVHEVCKDFDAQLVLVGPMGFGHEEILKAREASPNREQIILTGALPDAELAALVKNASLCMIPSLYEGFCLPMVEAMACGVPTAASNSSCIPEVSGGALEYFNPFSVEEMAEVIRRVLEDSDLRDRLRQKSLARAGYFSWERCARETLHIFRKTFAQHGRKRPTPSLS